MSRPRMMAVLVGVVVLAGAACGSGDSGEGRSSATTDPGNKGEVLRVSGTLDPFDRPDDPTRLGAAEGGPEWFADVGTWGALEGQAHISSPVDGRNFVVVDLGQGDGAAQVTLTSAVNGAGLVFRYESPEDYWAVVAVPAYATWAIFKVVDGTEEVVANTGLSAVGGGTTVAVRLDGPTIDVALNGVVARTVTDDTLQDADKVGLTAQALPNVDPGAARFDDFRVALPGDREVPGPPPGEDEVQPPETEGEPPTPTTPGPPSSEPAIGPLGPTVTTRP